MESTPQKLEKNSQHAQVCGFVLKKKKSQDLWNNKMDITFYFIYLSNSIYLPIFSAVLGLAAARALLQLQRAGATPRGARASHPDGFSQCRAPALGTQASLDAKCELVVVAMGSAAPWHLGSSQTRDWTRVSHIGRWILYHWANREPLLYISHQVLKGLHNVYSEGVMLILQRKWGPEKWKDLP